MASFNPGLSEPQNTKPKPKKIFSNNVPPGLHYLPHDPKSDGFLDLFRSFLLSKDERKAILALAEEDAKVFIEIIDRVFRVLRLDNELREITFRVLVHLCSRIGRLPDSYLVSDKFDLSGIPYASGGFSDVWKGSFRGKSVAVKSLKISDFGDIIRIRQRFCKEVVTWKNLSHPNVLNLIGVLDTLEEGRFSVISEWMANGDLTQYVRTNAGNHLKLLADAVEGLRHLHKSGIVHGDLKGANILITDTEPVSACLSDFGCTTIVYDPGFGMEPLESEVYGGTTPFMAPERLVPSKFGLEDGTPTMEADIYAMAMTIYQVLTGTLPFGKRTGPEVMFQLLGGVRPSKPKNALELGLSDEVWKLLEDCWQTDRQLRPPVNDVLGHVRSAASACGTLPPVGGVARRDRDPASDFAKFDQLFADLIPGELPLPSHLCQRPMLCGIVVPEGIGSGRQMEQTPGVADSDNDWDIPGDKLPARSSSSHSIHPPSSAAGEDVVSGSLSGNDYDRVVALDPLPVPADCFSQVTNEILDLTDQVASVALFGSIGVGKSFVARTVLDHGQTKAKYGENRYFVRCDDLMNSLEGFIECLSGAIYTDATQLQLRLQSSPPLILLLDGVDSVLDPLTPEAEEMHAWIEEFGGYEHVCLVTTSRIYPDIHGFHRVKVPTPPEDGARDIFYSLCNLHRSPAVDALIAGLDYNPFSIELLARSTRENSWDEQMLLKAWDDRKSVLRTRYYQGLKEMIEPVLRSPRIKEQTMARDILEAVASFQSGIRECQLEGIFSKKSGVKEVVDVLCVFSLISRRHGDLKMPSPLQFYFLESMLVYAETEEVIRWDDDCMPAQGGLLALFGRWMTPTTIIDVQEGLANVPLAAVQENPTNIPRTTLQENPANTSPAAAQEDLVNTPPIDLQQQILPEPVAYELD
ncbi:hypothetical protein BJ322DRAFT_1111962 [Thelephora terrestris]|uniref:Protein kinase domain-containing protein n=1 Tax=Thelephora terrestris TaxID=56493 RepID=A0A9P6H834_9AGAM|nr:hypothetical protein BJ322DRAFT_1111962 [Thelephora terrestris]